MNAECVRIADQIRRAFGGDAWHGPPLSEVLAGVTAEQASARPIPSAHTIWEIVLHIDMYVAATVEALTGTPMPHWYGTEQDWPAASGVWADAVARLFTNAEQLAASVEAEKDLRLAETVPGREYDFYLLLHGVVQHSLWHGGQIAMLKRAGVTLQ